MTGTAPADEVVGLVGSRAPRPSGARALVRATEWSRRSRRARRRPRGRSRSMDRQDFRVEKSVWPNRMISRASTLALSTTASTATTDSAIATATMSRPTTADGLLLGGIPREISADRRKAMPGSDTRHTSDARGHVPLRSRSRSSPPFTPGSPPAARPRPVLSSGSLPLPHLGDCTHDGHPRAHGHWRIASASPRSHRSASSRLRAR